MKRRILGSLVTVTFAIIMVVACTPQTVPGPTPMPTLQAIPLPGTLAPASPALSPEDVAWAKVVEAAQKEGKLTVYSVHLVGDVATSVSQAFTKRTGLRLEIIGGPSNTALERVKVERRAGLQVASVMTGNAGMFLVAKQQDGLTQSVGDLPELRTKDIRFEPRLDKEGHVLGMSGSTYSTWINTNLVKPGTEPRSYKDLLKPEWKGQMTVGDPITLPTANVLYWMLTSRGKLDDVYFRALGKQALQFQPSSRMDMAVLSRGQVPIVVVGATSSAGPFLAEGAPIKAIDMVEGVPISRASVASLLQGAPHPNAGRVFINWLFSPEGLTVFTRTIGVTGFRKDVPSFEPSQAQLAPVNPIILSSEDELQAGVIQREGILKKLLVEDAK